VNDELIRNIGKCIECQGKLLLHKNAQQHEMSTTPPKEVMTLIKWVSESVFPSFTKLIYQDNTLRDLDLSGISGIDSPMNSPDAVLRRSRNSSFPRMSLGLSNASAVHNSFNVYQDQSKFICTIATAVSSLRSVMLMIADWLTLSRTCHATVMDNIVSWCQMLKCSDEVVCKPLLPLFCRLALLCLTNDTEPILLNEILALVRDGELADDDDEETLATFTSRGLASVHDDHVCKVGIASILNHICLSSQRHELNGKPAGASTFDRIAPGLKTIFMSLVEDRRCSLMLAQHLAHATDAVSVRADLLKEISVHAIRTPALNKILKECDHDVIVNDGDVAADSTSIENEDSVDDANPTQEVSNATDA
jgi:hypothetical protein